MATFRIRYGGDYEFEGQSLSEVVPVMYRRMWSNDFPNPDEGGYMRSALRLRCVSGTRGRIIMIVGLVLLIVWLGMVCWNVFLWSDVYMWID